MSSTLQQPFRTGSSSPSSSSSSSSEQPDAPWVEKYRPATLEDVKGQDHIIRLFHEMLQSNRPMHFLFYGPPGTGKTSTISSLCQELYASRRRDHYVLDINASYDCGIDMVRNKIKPFCKRSTAPFEHQGNTIDYKFVILDEADTLTKDAQNALRRCIEIYSYNTRFCFLCNYVSNVLAPILSRCCVCHFKPVAKPDAMQFLASVCAQEHVHVPPDSLQLVYTTHRGDLRGCLTTLQAVHAMYNEVTLDHVKEHLFHVPDTLWTLVQHATSHKGLLPIVDALYADGYSVRRLLQSLVPWLLANATDTQMYALVEMVSRLECQALERDNNRTLLWELVVGVWKGVGQGNE